MNYSKNTNQINFLSDAADDASSREISKIKLELISQLNEIKAESYIVLGLVQHTRMREYKNLAAIYAWWIAASREENLLDELYKATEERRVNETGTEFNFRRLLYLVYGNYGLDKDVLDRKNRALIRINEEYLRHTSLYEHDTVLKLASFIKSSGGIEGLIKEKSNPNQESLSKKARGAATNQIPTEPNVSNSDSDTGLSAANTDATVATAVAVSKQPAVNLTAKALTKPAPVSQLNRQRILNEEAENYFSEKRITQIIQISTPIETDRDDLSLALIKRVGDGYEMIGSMLPSKNIVQEVLSETYSKEFNAIPAMLRPLLETIKTQAMPTNLTRIFEKQALRELDNPDSNGDFRYLKRIVYISASNSLLLSSVSTDSSVVTRAKLKNALISSTSGDYHLPVRCVKLLEQRLLASNDFNMFKPATNQIVAIAPRLGVNSHAVQLNSKASVGGHVNLDFWRFEQGMTLGNEQVDFIYSEDEKTDFQFLITAADLKAFAFDHCNKWLASYGDYINRPEHQIVGIEIGQQGLTLRYELESGKFNNWGKTSIGSLASTQSAYSARFLACDLLVAISGIAALDIEGRVNITACPDVILIDFATSVADYSVAIPTVNGTVRNSSVFTKYQASIAKGAGTVSTEQLQDPEYRAWILENNEMVDDAALEQVLGLGSGDHEDFLAGDEEILNAVS